MDTGISPLIEGQPSILLTQWVLDAKGAQALGVASAREFSIHGAKVPVVGRDGSWRAHYLVRETRADGAVVAHHLAQRDGVLWTADGACLGCDMADMVKPSAIPSLAAKPRWKRDAGCIPTRPDGRMYMFLKQFHVPISAKIRAHFHCGFSLYLFATPQGDDALELAMFEQDMSEQTAQDHYRLEEQIATFLQAPRNLDSVEALIRGGDKHFHEFVLESPKSTQAVLAMLMQHAKTKTLKSAIQARITELSSKVDSQ